MATVTKKGINRTESEKLLNVSKAGHYQNRADKLFTKERESEEDSGLVYIPPVFAQLYLPQRAITSHTWIVENPNFCLTVSTSERRQIPYGCFPRLFLAYISTEIIRKGTIEIDLGNSQAELLNRLGFYNTGRHIELFNRSVADLFSSQFELQIKNPQATKQKKLQGDIYYFKLASRLLLWEHSLDGKKTEWTKKLYINKDFFNYVTRKRGIPINYHRLANLCKSALAMDLYVWLLYRLYILQRSRNQHCLLTFEELKQQFQPNSSQSSFHFKAKFLNCLSMVLPLLPDFQDCILLSDDKKHLMLIKPKKSVEAVLKKDNESTLL
ncbi:replication protein RepA [Parasutterella excrementihominis]|uniref:replication protein RepA n=1 Tax=Parasutterella excrementihominis TaxID=487175 RepID=UPI00356578A0